MNEVRPMARSPRVTIRTVAADSGVSVAAVSKVLRNAYGVSEGLRQKVNVSIEKLGYRPSVGARGMRGQTFTIGVLLVEIANPFLPEIIDGVNDVLAPTNYQVMLGVGQSNAPIEASLIESMIDYRMDGLILVAPRTSGEMLARFAGQIPIVVIGHHEATATNFDTINSDDQHGAAVAVRAFVQRGYADIMMLSLEDVAQMEESLVFQREIGYRAAMAAAGLAARTRIVRISSTLAERVAAFRAILQSPDRPRAVFCWSDLHAVEFINHAKTMGLSVPGDIAIIGYDNSRIAALPLIDLASIDQSGRNLGSVASETLLSRIGGRSVPRHVLLEPHLTVRSSI